MPFFYPLIYLLYALPVGSRFGISLGSLESAQLPTSWDAFPVSPPALLLVQRHGGATVMAEVTE